MRFPLKNAISIEKAAISTEQNVTDFHRKIYTHLASSFGKVLNASMPETSSGSKNVNFENVLCF